MNQVNSDNGNWHDDSTINKHWQFGIGNLVWHYTDRDHVFMCAQLHVADIHRTITKFRFQLNTL